jgi:acetyl esterase/lipase
MDCHLKRTASPHQGKHDDDEIQSSSGGTPEPMTDQPLVVEVTVQAFLDTVATIGTPPLHELDFEPARENLRSLQCRPVTTPPTSIEDRVFPVGPTGSVGVRIVRPHGSNGGDPVILYLHGGGWMMGGKDTHDRLLRELAAGAGATIIFVEYTLAPEARYPVQNEQAYAVLHYIVQNATELNLDPYRIAIAGDCAGGNIAAAVTLLAKQRRGPEIVFQLLFYPILGDVSDTWSYQTFKDGPWLTRRATSGLLDRLFPDPASRREITAFPLQASVLQLNDLPEALVIVAENDVVRDEGESYVRKLVQAGVRATSTCYGGTIHDFVMLNGLAEAPATRGAIAQASAALRVALYGK